MHMGLYKFTLLHIKFTGDDMIITVKEKDSLFDISKAYGVPQSKIAADNGLSIDDGLIIGQSLYIGIADRAFTSDKAFTVDYVSKTENIPRKTILRNNFILGGNNDIPKGTFIVLAYKDIPFSEKIIGGYAYDFISPTLLSQVINYLTYIMPFTYGFDKDANLIIPNDNFILEKAKTNGVSVLFHLSTLTGEGYFDSELPKVIFSDKEKQQKLIEGIITQVIMKDYAGADIDFEYLPENQKQNYVDFTLELSSRLHKIGKILVIALPPKESDSQRSVLIDGLDYAALSRNADFILSMTYEYGYKFGPPLAIAPIDRVRKAVEYSLGFIPSEKLLLGIPNYGYDWTLPYIEGESDAPSISTSEALRLARMYGANIQYDEKSSAPYFFYTDTNGRKHEVWFEDARSIKSKIDLIKEYNLAGGFIWDLMRENPSGYTTINSLIHIK